jgi:competence CoiA-like predicted nuclease
MPFIAVRKATSERIDITQIRFPKAELKRGEIVCQICGADLIIRDRHFRKGVPIRSHFAHLGNCNGQFEAHPESLEHLVGKVFVKEYLERLYEPVHQGYQIYFEAQIEMQWRPKGRIADILVDWPDNGWKEIHEIQLASITPGELQERTDDYARAGCSVTWWLGGRADNKVNREWCLSQFGDWLTIAFDQA